jgi:dimethylhistidine N-methyltransferase
MSDKLTFHDHKPRTLSLQHAVVKGLSLQQKAIAPKFFYDQRGSELFEMICEQPEYYPPTIEQDILINNSEEIAELTGTGRVLVEPGAGSAAKVRILLDSLQPSAYVPMDISFDHLKLAAYELSNAYPWLPVHATCVDYTHSLPIPDIVPRGPKLLFFPGSSIGNFEQQEVGLFLTMIREAVGEEGMLLIGVDTKKNESILNAAYNDEAGFTAEFNLNLLHRMRDELGVDCDPNKFDHKAFYNSEEGRIEMYLISKEKQILKLNEKSFELAKGEAVHTENSYKYTTEEFLQLTTEHGFKDVCHWVDKKGLFSIYLLVTL